MKPIYATVLAFVVLAALATPSAAGEKYVCWYGQKWDPVTFGYKDILICRIDGRIVDDGSPGTSEPLPPLTYDLGFDLTGECYYLRSGAWSGWIPLGGDGTRIQFAWDIDGVPGGAFVGDLWVDQCVSEPTPGEPPELTVYRVIAAFPFAEPAPVLTPAGIGLTGAPTHLYVAPPPPATRTVLSPLGLGAIDVEFDVVAVTIDWGDGTAATIPQSAFELFVPYPDGAVAHVWETKGDYAPQVGYVWFVRWRVAGSGWSPVAVPATTWSEPYRVDEVVGRRTD